MNDTPLILQPPRGRGPKLPLGYPVARLALLFFALLNVIWAAAACYRLATVVRQDRALAFAWHFVASPASFATIAILAIWWVHQQRPAGAAVASALLAFHGLRTALSAAAGSAEYRNATERMAGTIVELAFALIFLGAAASFAAAALSFRREGTAAGS